MEILHFAKSRRGGELIGIVILAAGLSLGAALVTYHPDDSSAFYTSTNNAISNAIGYYGATVAWIFVGFFGFASLLFPLGMLVIGWQRFWGKDVEYVQTKAFGWVTLLIAVPPLLDLTFGKVWLRGALIASGGYLGQEIDQAAITNLNRGGSAILFGTMLLVGILLSTRISLAAISARQPRRWRSRRARIRLRFMHTKSPQTSRNRNHGLKSSFHVRPRGPPDLRSAICVWATTNCLRCICSQSARSRVRSTTRST